MKKSLIWILLALVLVGIFIVYPYYQRIFAPNVTIAEGDQQEFFIPTGSDYVQVGEKLLSEKLINNPKAFHWVAEQMNYPNHVYPGRYMLKNGMTTRELVQLLRSGKQSPMDFTFIKFRTLDQLAEHTSEKLEMSRADLLQVLKDQEFLSGMGLTEQTTIGIFVPNTYELYWTISPKAFVKKMYDEYRAFWDKNSRNAKREKLNLTRMEVMSIASIVEEETNLASEKATIAGVYLNRIRRKMPLQADPTVKFAVGDFTIRRVLNKHLAVESPYNTYLNAGIPPGPICTPSIPSIDAVLAGERHNYLYFVASIDGKGHKFSESLSQHNAYANEYRELLNQRGIR